MAPETSQPATFKSIALCLSGGGYRAAAFSLGTIDMLDELRLMDKVKLFSTVSGGTFTGLTYAAWLAEGESYKAFYDDLYEFLKTNNCIDEALDDLYDTPSPSGMGDLSLIRSAAEVYSDSLFKERKFRQVAGLVGDDKRFLELIFNSTEFRKGNSFRFRASHNPRVNAGNGDFEVAEDIAGEILLADVVAASSCFPGGFEPIRFPDDFRWTESGLENIRERLIKDIDGHESGFRNEESHDCKDINKKDKKKEKQKAIGECITLPLMDGGIYDNQGTSNAILADRRVPVKKSAAVTGDTALDDQDNTIFDLFVIADTSARDNDIFNYPDPVRRTISPYLNTLFWLAIALFFIFGISTVVLIRSYLREPTDLPWFQLTFEYIVPIVLMAVIVAILLLAYLLFRRFRVIEVSNAEFHIWDTIKRMTLFDCFDMGKSRISSLLAMSSNIFMKRIRQLEFNVITSDPVRKNKVAFDLIYDLNPTVPPDRPKVWELDATLKPTDKMKDISCHSEAVATTLWFEGQEENLQLLIVCGQCTIVYSLLRYLWQRWYLDQKRLNTSLPKPNESDSPWFDLYNLLHKRWDKLKENPRSFLDRER